MSCSKLVSIVSKYSIFKFIFLVCFILIGIVLYFELKFANGKRDPLRLMFPSSQKFNEDLVRNQLELLKESNKELKENLKLLKEVKNLTNYLKRVIKPNKFKSNDYENQIKTTTNTTTTKVINDEKPNVHLFDLNQKLEPIAAYEPIQCRKSANIIVSTTLCIHNLNNDVHVSGSIWRDGVWESHIVKPYINYINTYPDWLVLDIGAQIGQYSLFPAKMGRQVLCVEPFYDNILRIHKAATQENIQNNIVLIKNAISDKRNEIKMLHQENQNIGGQSLLDYKDQKFVKDNTTSSNKYLVETILFDDIIPYLPKTKDNKDFKKAIMKIDIEGFEPYAFQHANKLFDILEINVIYMEWGQLPKQFDNHNLITQMIDFLYARNFIPYGNDMKLIKENWKSWPWDIIWKKSGF